MRGPIHVKDVAKNILVLVDWGNFKINFILLLIIIFTYVGYDQSYTERNSLMCFSPAVLITRTSVCYNLRIGTYYSKIFLNTYKFRNIKTLIKITL